MKLQRGQLFALTLSLIVTLVGGAMLFAWWIEQSVQVASPPSEDEAAPVGPQFSPEETAFRNRILQERLGTDDGAVAAIFYGATIQGSLETCG